MVLFLTIFTLNIRLSCNNVRDENIAPIANYVTYYVDSTNGNDANDGRSKNSSWKSLELRYAVICDNKLFKAEF